MDLQSLAPGMKKSTGAFGNPSAEIVFVGESPTAYEISKGEVNNQVLKILGDVFPDSFDADNFYYINSVPYFLPKSKDKKHNTKVTQDAAHNCHQWLHAELAKHPRKIVVALGNTAMWALTNDDHYKITQIRGQLFESPVAAHGILASVHPSFLLMGGGSYPKFKRDINYALDLAAGVPRLQWVKPTWEVARKPVDVLNFMEATFSAAADLHDFVIGADIETGGFNHLDDEILEIGWCIDPNHVWIVPENLLKYLDYQDFMKPKREGGMFKWTWHNGKFDVKFLRNYKLSSGVDHDSMLMSYSMEERRGFHDLDQVASDELGAPMHKDMIEEYLPNKKTSYREIPEDVRHEYLAYDVSKTKGIFKTMHPRVHTDSKNTLLYNDVLLEASELLAGVEENGMLVDREKQAENVKEFTIVMDKHKAALNKVVLEIDPEASYTTSGSKRDGGGVLVAGINPNSPKQVDHLLYNQLKLGRTGQGTGADILDKLPDHDVVKALQKYRKAAKLFGTFVKKLPEQIASDGRVHSTYLIHGTATGRLSSRDPNMQNQPRDPRIRGQFIAAPGYKLCEMDLDQAELRCLAALSGDEALCHIYETEGLSLHKVVSKELWDDTWSERYALDLPGNTDYDRAKEEYMRTKALNFGIVYGREAPSIAKEFEIPTHEAQRMIDGWATQFPTAWAFIAKCRMAPIRGQNLTTPFGRRKRAGVAAREKIKDLQNEASNFPHQSIASDITLLSAVKAEPWLTAHGIKIVNLIHDAILVEYPDDDDLFKAMANHTTSIMEQTPIDWGITRIPFSADAKTGERWGDLQNTAFK